MYFLLISFENKYQVHIQTSDQPMADTVLVALVVTTFDGFCVTRRLLPHHIKVTEFLDQQYQHLQ